MDSRAAEITMGIAEWICDDDAHFVQARELVDSGWHISLAAYLTRVLSSASPGTVAHHINSQLTADDLALVSWSYVAYELQNTPE